jgi:hypothetical protein
MEVVGAAAVAFMLTTLYLQQTAVRSGEHIATDMSSRAAPAHFASPTAVQEKARAAQPNVASSLMKGPQATAAPSLPSQARVQKDPYAEQERELAEYFGGISNVAPVNEPLKQALLESKLRHRIALDMALKDAGVRRETLSSAERAYAHETATRALTDYQRDFLIDVKPLLSEQQYTLLADFEATEFKRRLAALQTEINSR